ncbi:MAG TPA: DUF2335 domain-containing protein [Bryobacteraceae bacterium]|jgi:uncharacterized membrane protein
MSAKPPKKPNGKQVSPQSPVDPTRNYPVISQVVQQASFSGPLPPPAILKQYNDIVPGAAERILSAAELEGDHRRRLELLVLEHNGKILRYTARDILLGQIFAFILSLGFLVLAADCIYTGYPWAGAILSAIGFGGIVSTFIFGRSGSKKPNE